MEVTSKLPNKGAEDMRRGGDRRNLSGNRWTNELGTFDFEWDVVWNTSDAAELSDL